MLDEQMSEEDIEEGLTLGSLMDHEHYWPALQRIVKFLEDDAVGQFCDDDKKGKKWLKGARDTARAIIPAIVNRAQDAQTAIEERKEATEAIRSRADDGTGSGDLAL